MAGRKVDDSTEAMPDYGPGHGVVDDDSEPLSQRDALVIAKSILLQPLTGPRSQALGYLLAFAKAAADPVPAVGQDPNLAAVRELRTG